jgi:hypothetical protein
MNKLFLPIALFYSSSVYACKCHLYKNEESKFSNSEIIILVKGLHKSTIVGDKLLSEFEVIESFKGPAKRGQIVKIDTMSETSCSGPTNSKHIHLFYAHKKEQNYGVSRCGNELFQRVEYKGRWYGLDESEVEKRLVTLRELANET